METEAGECNVVGVVLPRKFKLVFEKFELVNQKKVNPKCEERRPTRSNN